MKIALAQINPTVGDIDYNRALALAECKRAYAQGAELIIFPELAITGYPPKDLLLGSDFLAASQKALEQLARLSPIALIIGAPWSNHPAKPYNAAVLCHKNQLSVVGRKRLLPNYGVFDEQRYFSNPETNSSDVLVFNNKRFLITICEDAWNTGVLNSPSYSFDPIALGINQHGPVDMIINLSASPYTKNKPAKRELLFSSIAKNYRTPLALCGQVGANDQLLFDGHSMYFNCYGDLVARAPACKSELVIIDTNQEPNKILLPSEAHSAKLCLEVLSMGIRDYVTKCRAPGVLIGLSGGVDSAVVAALAVNALGVQKVRAFYLPSQFSSLSSERDALLLADNLGINLELINIEPTVNSLRHSLHKYVSLADAHHQDIVDQNLQARARGVILMALANTTDYLMLATANKSELAVGYSTSYGDLCGALAPLGDAYKTQVYQLALELKTISYDIINKQPSAELKNNQKDCDTLPDYYILDQILECFIEQELNPEDIRKKTNLNISLINQVISMVNKSEYKRRQAPFSLMISEKVFGDARRLPMTRFK